MIGGFITEGGNGSTEVIVRALGPTLSNFGVANALADPTLELRDINGNLIRSNDNWRSTQQAEIIATGLQPSNDAESAIVATLAPSNYTMIVRGLNSTTGVALVEVLPAELDRGFANRYCQRFAKRTWSRCDWLARLPDGLGS